MNDSKAVVWTIDIETTPLMAWSWGPMWDTSLAEVIEQTKVLSYSAKRLNSSEHITKGLINYKGYKRGVVDDKKIVTEIWSILDGADIVIGQNLKDFDVKVLNARFIEHGLTPPSPYKVVDTQQEAKKNLRLPSYKLDYICDYFDIGRKIKHEGFPLWIACMSGDKNSWKKMLEYNKNDVILTETLYNKMLPWIKSHPNVGMYTGKKVCPKCGADALKAEGWERTRTMQYRKYSCKACGSWGRDVEAAEREKPIVSIQ